MKTLRRLALRLLLVGSLAGSAGFARAEEACIDFKWDVSKERALFAAAPVALSAGKDSLSAPAIVPDRLYKLRLAAQDEVAFSISPKKKAAAAGAFAGLAALKIPSAGAYRIAIDLPLWIDVVSSGSLVAAKDFQGQHSCNAPHKIVEFELSGARPFLLQFSSGDADTVLVTVTASPPRKM
jgi:hypothetical protein